MVDEKLWENYRGKGSTEPAAPMQPAKKAADETKAAEEKKPGGGK